MATPQPGIGDWYRLDSGSLFEVVAYDDDDGTIEIQYFDGTVEEMDIEDWKRSGKTARSRPRRHPRTGVARWTSTRTDERPWHRSRRRGARPPAPAARSRASTCSNSPRR